jgi:hypothetical protein
LFNTGLHFNIIAEKRPRNAAGFCGGGQGLSWTVEPRKEEEDVLISSSTFSVPLSRKMFQVADMYCKMKRDNM